VIEQLKIIDPLTNPTAHGASASDAFHLVIPSMAGYGFSGKPTTTGWGPDRMARAWVVLMKRLGYTRFVAQGGDWGALITDLMGVHAAPELLGIHTNMPGAVPPDCRRNISAAANPAAPPPTMTILSGSPWALSGCFDLVTCRLLRTEIIPSLCSMSQHAIGSMAGA